jgi:hypothetical protein
MKGDKKTTVEIAARLFNSSRAVMERTYDIEMPNMSDDGHFDPKGLAVLKESFVDMGMLPNQPDDAAILTRRFVSERPRAR